MLTVAHRLGTIIYYDRVMVLSGPVPGPAGRIEQYDSPANLLKDTEVKLGVTILNFTTPPTQHPSSTTNH